jgi:16S rRNA (guanine966-N2)-methyltransferase
VEALGLTGATKIWRRDATKLGPAGTMSPFDLIFCDPPYGKDLGEAALAAAVDGGWTTDHAIAALEERAGTAPAWPAPLSEIDRRRYGETEIAIAQASN